MCDPQRHSRKAKGCEAQIRGPGALEKGWGKSWLRQPSIVETGNHDFFQLGVFRAIGSSHDEIDERPEEGGMSALRTSSSKK
jgi:hypothetical protein